MFSFLQWWIILWKDIWKMFNPFPTFELSLKVCLKLFFFCKKIYYQLKIKPNPHAIVFKICWNFVLYNNLRLSVLNLSWRNLNSEISYEISSKWFFFFLPALISITWNFHPKDRSLSKTQDKVQLKIFIFVMGTKGLNSLRQWV